MKNIHFFLFAVGIVFISCHQEDLAKNEIEIILSEKEDGTRNIVTAMKNIEIINLQIDSNYMYNEDAQLRVSNNYYYFVSSGVFDPSRIQLMCYDNATGKLLLSRNIKGRARNECIEVCNWYVKDDKIVINDCGTLKMYDHTGKFYGVLGKAKSNCLLPMGDGFVNFIIGGFGNNGKGIMLLDSAFNEKKSYFDVPDEYITGSYVRLSNTSPDKYVLNDTLRFLYQYTFRLHYFPGNKTYHFITPHPIPQSLLSNSDGEFKSIINDCVINGYANYVTGLAENQNYITFKYMIGNFTNFVLLSKRDNKVFCVGDDSDVDETDLSNIVWINLLLGADIIYSDGKYFYMRAGKALYKLFDKYKDELDDRQRTIYEAMHRQMTANDVNDFNCFYFKIEF